MITKLRKGQYPPAVLRLIKLHIKSTEKGTNATFKDYEIKVYQCNTVKEVRTKAAMYNLVTGAIHDINEKIKHLSNTYFAAYGRINMETVDKSKHVYIKEMNEYHIYFTRI